ncbi:PLP-dependent aminotransferase family protein [Polaribacter tangerinus]|uniref:aminotransferase-like domain-containing protein n=1 Tax=Polaribacter tangerinus TaxID=1920034 RepID=UPI000B4B20F5|nr:PLP-dependent aminotransferase family protein [Polaribacter tangerinus]
MNDSPVNDILKQLISIDRKTKKSIYIQVSQQIINAIQRKYLVKGTKLPGTRKLSTLLNIHRNTAVAIYDELAAQGWVKILPNSGTFILESDANTPKLRAKSFNNLKVYSYANTTGFPFQEAFHLASTKEQTKAKYSINDGKPDLRLHPVQEFTRWYSAAMKRKMLLQKWNRPSQFSNTVFQIQLCNHLNVTRGLHVRPKNVISTRSTEMSLYIVSQLLVKNNDLVIVGELSNYAANTIFQEAGATIKTVPVDSKGINISFIKKIAQKNQIRCVYISANRHYPTTATLSTARRVALLQLAKEYKFAIIEDDYDYDFQFKGSAMLPMASADANGMIIYLGKIGQSLFPSFQIGFVVAPENLITEAKNYLELLDKQGDLIQEQIVSELIDEGEIYRLIKKNTNIYKERNTLVCKELTKHFKTIAKWKVPSGGLAIWLEFTPKIPLLKLAEAAEKNDLYLPKTVLYQNKKTCAIRLGFGHLNTNEIPFVITKLKKAYLTITA